MSAICGDRANVAQTIKAAAPALARPRDNEARGGESAWHPFALMGADFLLDDRLHAWMTEVQEGPGLSHIAERVKEDFVPSMVSQAAAIGVEAARRLANGGSLDGVEDGTDFEALPLEG